MTVLLIESSGRLRGELCVLEIPCLGRFTFGCSFYETHLKFMTTLSDNPLHFICLEDLQSACEKYFTKDQKVLDVSILSEEYVFLF